MTKHPTNENTRDYFETIGLVSISGYQDRYEAITASLQALREFGIVQFCPVAYAAIELAQITATGTSDLKARTLVRLFEALEKYHFVNNVICERVGNEVEHLYADTCLTFVQETDLNLAVEDLINSLRDKRAAWEEFIGRFADISYSSDQLPIICYIFDRINNYGLDSWATTCYITTPISRILRRNNNIEHFLPQNPPTALVIDDQTLKILIDNIGNLLPLYFRTNSRLGNLPPSEKARRLREDMRNEIQNLPFVQDFLTRYGDRIENWNAQAIQERARDLATLAFERVWSLG